MCSPEDFQAKLQNINVDSDPLIELITNMKYEDRINFKKTYKQRFNKDLIEDIKFQAKGRNLEYALTSLFTDPVEYDCKELYESMKGLGTKEDTLIEILGTRSSERIEEIVKNYQSYSGSKHTLEYDIKDDTSGNFRRILLKIIKTKRNDNENANFQDCISYAQELYKKGDDLCGKDNCLFIKYITELSASELKLVCSQYHKISGKNIIDKVKEIYDGESANLLKTLVHSTLVPNEYFAIRLRDAIKGWGTNNQVLIRVLVTRDKKDFPEIKRYYKKLFDLDLIEDIKGDISGNYQKLMVAICNN